MYKFIIPPVQPYLILIKYQIYCTFCHLKSISSSPSEDISTLSCGRLEEVTLGLINHPRYTSISPIYHVNIFSYHFPVSDPAARSLRRPITLYRLLSPFLPREPSSVKLLLSRRRDILFTTGRPADRRDVNILEILVTHRPAEISANISLCQDICKILLIYENTTVL